MTTFKKADKVKIKSGTFKNREGIVLTSDDNEIKVSINFNSDEDANRKVINIFSPDELELAENESLNEGDKSMEDVKFVNESLEEIKEEIKPEETEKVEEGLKLNEEELKLWLSDNDASFWTQEIDENMNVSIRGEHGNVLGTYNFNANLLKLNESLYDTDEIPTIEGEHNQDVIPDLGIKSNDEDYIRNYVYDVNIEDEKDEIPSWEFAAKIATAECVDEGEVLDFALKHNYKVFCITGYNFDKIVIAAKQIKKDDIYNDYADYLEGNCTVKEVR